MSNAYRLVSAVLAAGFGSTWMGAVEAGPTGGTVVAGDQVRGELTVCLGCAGAQ